MSQLKPETSSNRRRNNRGSVSIELLIILPALFAVMFLGMQAALIYHARTVAIAAAQEGARAAGGENSNVTAGIDAASTFITEAGGDSVLTGASASGQRTATVAVITVSGHSLSVIPGWTPVVRQSASVPVEKLTSP